MKFRIKKVKKGDRVIYYPQCKRPLIPWYRYFCDPAGDSIGFGGKAEAINFCTVYLNQNKKEKNKKVEYIYLEVK